MKTDSIFYEAFLEYPQLFFELINIAQAQQGFYSFRSQEIKQTAFRLDGLFLPHHRRSDLPIFFVEAQAYKSKKGENLYYGFFSEVCLYLNDYRPKNDWRGIILFTERRFDPGLPIQFQEYATGDRLQRIYLNQLPRDFETGALGISALQLITAKKSVAQQAAKQLVQRTKQEVANGLEREKILELISTVCVYKFSELTREEIETMLKVKEIRQSRVFQEAQEEKALSLILRQLNRRLGDLPLELETCIQKLPIDRLDSLAEALLDFAALEDLQSWLDGSDSPSTNP